MLVRVLTPLVLPKEKTFEVVLVCCSHDPSWLLSSLTIYFWQLFKISYSWLFLSIRCSHHLPTIFGSFWGYLYLFVFITIPVLPSLSTYFSWLFRTFCTCLSSSPSQLFLSLSTYFWWLFRIFCTCFFFPTCCFYHLLSIFACFWGHFSFICHHHHFFGLNF